MLPEYTGLLTETSRRPKMPPNSHLPTLPRHTLGRLMTVPGCQVSRLPRRPGSHLHHATEPKQTVLNAAGTGYLETPALVPSKGIAATVIRDRVVIIGGTYAGANTGMTRRFERAAWHQVKRLDVASRWVLLHAQSSVNRQAGRIHEGAFV